ncbi:putative enoyl-CoA hydratase/isomerase [Corynebacterium glutamicum MB001]|uniref:3-hydroxyisobutyryl-CoA hydrolase n=1 Tax=Corynebacterium glutamicum (strain ATCC 13032 / DSM 20300 / JCM 1318 / BCRC 11384 / CCUG 27702 / LMG 3730 / NBRC 12168 / NCIMB 10025 / NRRL B-2784 / 534) TaxID=196627 RepID=Q8NRX2_CORGL|nr:enoyl-CoA hydratase/isomerase family protein [Corynebacterium glutamicum]AGT04915.1 putative enoyl-CoA hydratase/isomerase [Corynebacterium glutamicum MB001]ARV64903.1 3-hydroxyisobutyryl-CoA hydrolase [Corynebacterium glutamicum]ASW13610.1 putative enoyl-CoA hydratase/isomerase [Corynebacterium glutamicum]AUI00478.1 enoyl-CoA hydratase/isomerase family protein [Corynebacterium glutamicum]AUI04122.1 enoyl-CoA hydratase/isomerase family protein [Corynebacterium glutamicum]
MSNVVNTFVQNSTGMVELNRPKALNSLNQEMIDLVQEALTTWADDDQVQQVLIYSSSERAFCAGGDVRAVRESVLEGDVAAGDKYFIDEFAMNNTLGTYPKPVISVINGVAMGGGMGISMHGSHRIVTEKAFASMPEMAIGYVPDVGFTYFGQRASSLAIATFLAVTGWRMSPADMLWAGVATHFVEDAQGFIDAVLNESLDGALEKFSTQPTGSSELAGVASQIEETFGHSSWALIDASLRSHPDAEFVAKVDGLMASAAPASVVATVKLMHQNSEATTLREGLDNELAMSLYMIRQPDFAEGVRAVLVDKDRNAAFSPANYEDVDESHFVTLFQRSS